MLRFSPILHLSEAAYDRAKKLFKASNGIMIVAGHGFIPMFHRDRLFLNEQFRGKPVEIENRFPYREEVEKRQRELVIALKELHSES